MIPPSVATSADAEKLNSLIDQTARRIADVIEDAKRDPVQGHGESAFADGTITFRFGSQTCLIGIAKDVQHMCKPDLLIQDLQIPCTLTLGAFSQLHYHVLPAAPIRYTGHTECHFPNQTQI